MLKDQEGNVICPELLENNHVKITGRSGSGKSYYSCRHIEELSITMPVFVVDFSGSYTEKELTQNELDIDIRVLNPKEKIVGIFTGETEVVDNVTDSLITVFEIKAMMQRRILREACEKMMQEKESVSFLGLFQKLEELSEAAEDSEYKKNADFLMSRLYHLKSVDALRISPKRSNYISGVCILQLSDFPERIRKTLAQFVLEINGVKYSNINKCVFRLFWMSSNYYNWKIPRWKKCCGKVGNTG